MTAAFRWSPALAQEFHNHHVISIGGSASAAEKYCLTAKHFFNWVAAEDVPLTSDTVNAWMRHLYLNRNNRSNATRASRLSGLRTVCRWLVSRGLLAEDPTAGVPTPKFSASSAQKFSTMELAALFKAPDVQKLIGIRDRAILMLFYATGMRRQEMGRLTMDRLKLGPVSGRVHILGKGAKHRVVSFEGPVIDALQKWIVVRSGIAAPDEHAVFVAIYSHQAGSSGLALGNSGLGFVIKRAAHVAGLRRIDVFLHKLRSTFATDLYDAGKPVGEIRILMGHGSEITTWRYIAISERHLRTARLPNERWREIEEAGADL